MKLIKKEQSLIKNTLFTLLASIFCITLEKMNFKLIKIKVL